MRGRVIAMHDASQIEADFAATAVDGVAADALLGFEELRAAGGIAGNHGQDRPWRGKRRKAKQSNDGNPRPQTHTTSMSRPISRMQPVTRRPDRSAILPTVSWC